MKVISGSFSSVRFLFVSVLLTLSILLTGCGQDDPLLDAAGEDGSPIVEDFAIAYIKRPVSAMDTTRGPRSIPQFPEELDANDPTAGITPGDVYVRDLSSPSATETNITSYLTSVDLNDPSGLGEKSAGDVSDLEVNYDGTRLVFSLHKGSITGLNDDMQPYSWDLYEFDLTQPVIPGTNPRRLMNELEAIKGDDIDPHYLPDGRIVFTSSRQTSSRGLQAITGLSATPYLEEDQRNDPAFVLHIMDASGDNIKQLTFNQSHEFNPTVLMNGKILFSRWEKAGPRNAFSFYTINPDGTGLELLYGAHSHDPATSEQAFYDVKQMQSGELLATLLSYSRPRTTLPDPANPGVNLDDQINHFNDGEMVVIDQQNFVEIDQKKFSSPSLASVGQYSATNNEVPRDGNISQRGRYYSPHPLWEDQGGNRVLVAWSACRMTNSIDDTINLVASVEDPMVDIIATCQQDNIDNPNLKEAPPFYGIYMYDLVEHLKKPIVLPVEGIAAVDPVAIVDRPFDQTPAILADQPVNTGMETRGVGAIHIRSVYDTQGAVAMVDTPLEPLGATTLTAAERAAIPTTTIYMDPATGEASTTDGGGYVARTVADLPRLADPMQTPSNQRVARFVRITKAVPTIDDNNINGNDFGRSGGYEMREILGYAPVEPDGSVYTEVPAEVPFTIEVLDAKGRSLMPETTWLQLKPGEVRECNGCHAPRDGQQSINLGAQSSAFPNTNPATAPVVLLGETMAEARARSEKPQPPQQWYVNLNMDMVDNNVWANPNELTEFTYLNGGGTGLSTTSPVSDAACTTEPDDWDWGITKCRINITYETHIQPLLDAKCVVCHNDDDPNVVPAGHLALDGAGQTNAMHLTVQAIRDNRTNQNLPPSYEMLFATRPRMEVVPTGGTRFIVVRDPATDMPIDVDGNIIAEADFGNLQFIDQRPGMVSGGVARARFSRLVQVITGDQMRLGSMTATPTVDHTLLLTDGEKRLIIEWIDNGTQVTNDPVFAAISQ